MALTAGTRIIPSLPTADLSNCLPTPSRQRLLQREIEDTLLTLSSLPEAQEQRILLDFGPSPPFIFPDCHSPDFDQGTENQSRHIAIQCNQLPHFERLEKLVGQLTPEERTQLLSRLHPAMSVQEREALKLVVEHGFKGLGVVPKPLRVKKVSSADRHGGDAEERMRANVGASASIPEPLRVRMQDGLSFPELTKSELEVRRRELTIALAEKDTGLAEMFTEVEDAVALKPSKSMPILSPSAAAEARRKKQEVAKMFSLAAKKLQALDDSLGLVGPIQPPTLKDGLHFVKAAGSALRAYADVTPREVVVRTSQESGRPSREVARPATIAEQARRGEAEAEEEEEVEPPWMNELFLKRLSEQRAPAPELVVSRAAGGGRRGERAPPIVQQQLPRSVTLSAMASMPPPLPPPPPAAPAPAAVPAPAASSVRPQSDPPAPSARVNRSGKRQSTCPWPDSFFTSPRAAPVPRASSLPAAPLTPRSEYATLRRPSLPPSSPIPPTPPPKSPRQIPRATRQESHISALSSSSQPAHTASSTPSSISEIGADAEPTLVKRKGSIAAARAGIAERARRESRNSAVMEVKRKTSYPRLGMFWGGKR